MYWSGRAGECSKRVVDVAGALQQIADGVKTRLAARDCTAARHSITCHDIVYRNQTPSIDKTPEPNMYVPDPHQRLEMYVPP